MLYNMCNRFTTSQEGHYANCEPEWGGIFATFFVFAQGGVIRSNNTSLVYPSSPVSPTHIAHNFTFARYLLNYPYYNVLKGLYTTPESHHGQYLFKEIMNVIFESLFWATFQIY